MFKSCIHIAIAAICAIIICALAGTTIYYRSQLGQCRDELGRVRVELDNATNQQQTITDGLTECLELCRDAETVLSESATSLSGLREQIRILRNNYEYMETRLYQLRGDNAGSYDNNDK